MTYIVFSANGGPRLADAHFLRKHYGLKRVLFEKHVPELRRGGCCAMPLHVDSIPELATMYSEIHEAGAALRFVRSADDIAQCKQDEGTIACVLAPTFKLFQQDPDLLYVLSELGPMFVTLSLNMRNLLTDGCGELKPSGLSVHGRAVVRRLAELGAVIDVSHVSEPGFWDIVDLVDGPIIASHSNARALTDNKRNLSDAQIRAIADTGGCIGASVHDSLLRPGGNAAIEDYADNIKYIADLVGHEYVCCGSDFVDFMVDRIMPGLRASNPDGSIYHDDYVSPRGLKTFGDMSALPGLLERRGLSAHEIAAVMFGNLHRVVCRVWGTN